MKIKILSLALVMFMPILALAQKGCLKGRLTSGNDPLAFATITLAGTKNGTTCNELGYYTLDNIAPGNYEVSFSALGYQAESYKITIGKAHVTVLNASLKENYSKLNEVVVTGVSRATELRRNPVPIAVMTVKEMNQNVNNNIIDAIVKGVPGVNAVTTGPNISKPFIRGLGYNRVLILYDGVRQEGQQWGDEHGIEIDQYGIGRAEVIKGPASLTYGSDAIAGVINLIPAIPRGASGVLNGDYIADYHTNNGMVGTSLGLAYKKNDFTYTFRATAKTAHDYRDKIDGLVYNTGFREYNLSGMVRVDKKWGYSQIAATLYDNRQEIPDGSRDSLTRQFTKQVSEIAGDDIKNRPIVSNDELNSYSIAPLHQRIQHYRLYTHNQFNLGKGSIDVSLGGQQSIRREYDHPTLAQQAGLYVVLNTLNYDLKYNFPVFNGVETTIGLNGMYQANRSKAATDFPIPDYNLFDAGTFIFARKSFGKFDLSGGVRYDNRHISWRDFYVGPNPAKGLEQQVEISDTAGAHLQFPAFKHVYEGISGSLGLTYNVNERLLLKANIARGYRAPNITEIGSNGLDPGAHIVYLGNRSFNPEFSLQEDIGIISYLKDADLIAEFFNNHIDNYIYQARLTDANGNPVVIVPGNSTYEYQQSKARLYGAEFTVNLHPRAVKWLAFNNSVAYVTGINQNKELIAQSKGAAKYLPFIPPLHIRSELKVTLQRGYGALSKIYFKTEADVYASQNRFYALDNTETATPGYTLINVGAGATIKLKSQKTLCELFFQVDNLFNTAYQSNLNRLKYFEYYKASPNGKLGIYNIGRNMSFKAVFPF
ncbi:TonB-dependent receptor [Mucilaginibacter flavus]|uniref:TonB-dependent receptor n=1 Tax=Mucilaginibacter flavus TaxID=931504 RepID=UPI0025B56D62|nr:TonB-dependent receptor [Mucilaginibacter flavus]MDN3580798.1 TonB-dependent receptor [Mucilaginibacter flavus]